MHHFPERHSAKDHVSSDSLESDGNKCKVGLKLQSDKLQDKTDGLTAILQVDHLNYMQGIRTADLMT